MAMQQLLDFVNVQEWNIDTLRQLNQNLIEAAKLRRKAGGYDLTRIEGDRNQQFQDTFDFDTRDIVFRAGFQGFAVDLEEDVALIEECRNHLAALQKEWRNRLKDTSSQGPDTPYLNSLAERATFFLNATENPFLPKVHPKMSGGYFERRIEEEYLAVFLSGKGEVFRNFRECDNQKCGKMFIRTRNTQRFCQESCRHQYHNIDKIESGYLKDYIAKGRAEGKYF